MVLSIRKLREISVAHFVQSTIPEILFLETSMSTTTSTTPKLHVQKKLSKGLTYLLSLPKELRDPSAVSTSSNIPSKWPLILYLHGAGECGTDLLKLLKKGMLPAIIDEEPEFPFIVVSPQTLGGWSGTALYSLVRDILKHYPVDERRIYGTGLRYKIFYLLEINIWILKKSMSTIDLIINTSQHGRGWHLVIGAVTSASICGIGSCVWIPTRSRRGCQNQRRPTLGISQQGRSDSLLQILRRSRRISQEVRCT